MKKIVKSILRYFYYLFEFLIAFIMGYFMLFVGGGLIPVGDLKTEGDVIIYVKTNGVHTDICMPVTTSYFDWKNTIPITDYPNNNAFEFVSIGWGDKGFFLDTPEWSDLTFKTAFNAAFLASPTALHVDYLEREPVVSNAVAKVFINEKEYLLLVDYVCNSFLYMDDEIELIPNKGLWRTDNFYEAKGNYNLFKTCNSWTNRALKVAGIKTGWYALSSDGIMGHF